MNPLNHAAHPCAPGPQRAATSCTRTVSGAVVCRITGEVDPDTAPTATQALLAALNHGQTPPEVFVDLAEVRYFSAAGLTTLLTLREAATTAGAPLALVAPSPLVCRVLELTDTKHLFTIAARVQPAPEPG